MMTLAVLLTAFTLLSTAPALADVSPGALARPTATPPADAEVVAPGQSAQEALDRAKGKDAWVVLTKGTHTLPAALDVPGGVTLAGQGGGTILRLAAGKSGAVIANKDQGLRDLTIRDLAVDGGATAKDMDDRKAAEIDGILLVSSKPPDMQMQDVRIEHVTVRGCTGMGVHVKGVNRLTVVGCDFNGNGGQAGAGAKFMHNLYLRRVDGAEIVGNRLDHSPHGNGLNVSYSRHTTVERNEANGNGFRGIRVAETQGVVIRHNTAERNAAGGIVVNAEKDGCRDIDVQHNTANANGGYGIEIRRAREGAVRDNAAAKNGQGEVSLVGCKNVTGP